jgi:hypothetical protein
LDHKRVVSDRARFDGLSVPSIRLNRLCSCRPMGLYPSPSMAHNRSHVGLGTIAIVLFHAHCRCFGPGGPSTRDGNGYPKPETRWVFTLLGYGFGSIFIPMGLLMGINLYPAGLWVRVCSYSTQTHEPVGFLNPTKPSAYCHFIL